MRIEIRRYNLTEEYIDGSLYIGGRRSCSTVENTASSLPAGAYPVVMHHCARRGKDVPVILTRGIKSRPRCSRCKQVELSGLNTAMPCFCPQLGVGNGMCNRHDGAVLVGTSCPPGCLIHTQPVFERVSRLLQRVSDNGGSIRLVITDPFDASADLNVDD